MLVFSKGTLYTVKAKLPNVFNEVRGSCIRMLSQDEDNCLLGQTGKETGLSGTAVIIISFMLQFNSEDERYKVMMNLAKEPE